MKHLVLALCLAVIAIAVVGLAAHADWQSDTRQVLSELGTLDGCGAYTSNAHGLWCIGAGGKNLYQWNYETRTFDLLCAGGVDRLQWLYGVGIMAQGSNDPDDKVWWTPMGGGQCKAVRVMVE